eukprot:GHVT01003873.1.p1 GENE.GHVT01003873.1~~GHVT01003873.1.p1  ORF type:complete len:111 (-),score=2.79 GHVT01003873.1:264-596(-)
MRGGCGQAGGTTKTRDVRVCDVSGGEATMRAWGAVAARQALLFPPATILYVVEAELSVEGDHVFITVGEKTVLHRNFRIVALQRPVQPSTLLLLESLLPGTMTLAPRRLP